MTTDRDNVDVAIIGGGPAGAAAATLLTQKGYRVVVFEKDYFPRFHVGESLIPAVNLTLEKIGVAEAVKMNIPVIGICDTDCDPKWVDFVIPGNDDSAASLRYLLRVLGDGILKGSQEGAVKAAARGGDKVGASKGSAPQAAKTEDAIDIGQASL